MSSSQRACVRLRAAQAPCFGSCLLVPRHPGPPTAATPLGLSVRAALVHGGAPSPPPPPPPHTRACARAHMPSPRTTGTTATTDALTTATGQTIPSAVRTRLLKGPAGNLLLRVRGPPRPDTTRVFNDGIGNPNFRVAGPNWTTMPQHFKDNG